MTGAYWDQAAHDARFEWGAEGVRRLAPDADVVIIVDVLSFSTAVDVAVERGAAIYPCRSEDEAAGLAGEHRALWAVSRSRVNAVHPYSLSPASLLALPPGARLVLPSPNGATLALLAEESGAAVLAGCLRNAVAIARAARELGESVAVIAAGECWPDDGTLRPAVEDLAGAGAILDALRAADPSPEAQAAIELFRAWSGHLSEHLHRCASARELLAAGFADDVRVAVQLNASRAVPVLTGGAFQQHDGAL